MKNIFRLLLTASVFMIVFSCTEADDMASYNHSENIHYGAVLRTVEEMPQNNLINTSFDDSAFINDCWFGLAETNVFSKKRLFLTYLSIRSLNENTWILNCQ